MNPGGTQARPLPSDQQRMALPLSWILKSRKPCFYFSEKCRNVDETNSLKNESLLFLPLSLLRCLTGEMTGEISGSAAHFLLVIKTAGIERKCNQQHNVATDGGNSGPGKEAMPGYCPACMLGWDASFSTECGRIFG